MRTIIIVAGSQLVTRLYKKVAPMRYRLFSPAVMFYMNLINSIINYLSVVLILNVMYTLLKELRRKNKP
jgi:uncharacterized membrane protein